MVNTPTIRPGGSRDSLDEVQSFVSLATASSNLDEGKEFSSSGPGYRVDASALDTETAQNGTGMATAKSQSRETTTSTTAQRNSEDQKPNALVDSALAESDFTTTSDVVDDESRSHPNGPIQVAKVEDANINLNQSLHTTAVPIATENEEKSETIEEQQEPSLVIKESEDNPEEEPEEEPEQDLEEDILWQLEAFFMEIMDETSQNEVSKDRDARKKLPKENESSTKKRIEAFLVKHTDLIDNLEDDLSPLGFAITKGWCDVVEIMLSVGADVRKSMGDGRYPLHLAVQSGKLSMVEFLCDQNADIEAVDGYGETPLFDAVRNENLPILKCLLGKGAKVTQKSSYGRTPLHHASRWNNADGVDALLQFQEVDVNAQDVWGKTPLCIAADASSIACVK